MTRTGRLLVALSSALALWAGLDVLAQDTPEALLSCITTGTLVRHTYLQHTDPAKLKEAVRLFEAKVRDAEYPEGTIVRMIPQEAMVKRSKVAFPHTNGWEYFSLAVTPQGTNVRARGDGASNRIGTCSGCHAGAARSDYLCGGGAGCAAIPLTEEQIAQLQANDPRCPK